MRELVRRLRRDDGFGLVELLLALVMMNVAILALIATFTSSTYSVTRASRVSTAGLVADSQLERFRSMTYAWIGLDTAATTDSTYQSDSACIGGSTCSNVAPSLGASACRSGGTVYASFPANCSATQTVTGPDGRSYRLDTYVRDVQSVAIGNPRTTKVVTLVVRDAATGNRVLAREESNFDYCTALPDPSGTGASCT